MILRSCPIVVALIFVASTAFAQRMPDGPDRLPRMGATAWCEPVPEPEQSVEPDRRRPRGEKGKYHGMLVRAEARAKGAAKDVLRTARRMMERRVIIRGSCWDWVNAVFKRSGHPNKRGKRKTVFKGSRKRRRFANVNRIKPGDWLYYVNYQYKRVPHSAIFVGWLNRRKKQALMVSYRGARSRTPGGFGVYDLRSVYRIIRPN